MDRMRDSGSLGYGSIPYGCTQDETATTSSLFVVTVFYKPWLFYFT